jgi:hypothetical protein
MTMKMTIPGLCLALGAAALSGCMTMEDEATSTETAAVSVASFTFSPGTPVHVGTPITFDGSASVCGTSTCSYTWKWVYTTSGGGTNNGGQMGSGPVVVYSFDAFAASKPFVTVVLKVTENNTTHNFAIAQTSFTVVP